MLLTKSHIKFIPCRLNIPAYVFLLVTLPSLLSNAQSPDIFPLQTAIDKVQKAINSIEDLVDGGTVSDIKSQLFQSQSEKLAIERKISDLKSLQSDIEDLEFKAGSLKRDWESAQRRFKQLQRENEEKRKDLNRKIDSNVSRFKSLNEKWDVYEADLKRYESDAKAYERARIAFEDRKGTVDDPEYSRLTRWYNAVISWQRRLKAKYSSLTNDEKKLRTEGTGLRAQLNRIFADANLLKERQAMNKKERLHSDQNRKAEIEKRKMAALKSSINSQIQQEISSLNDVLTGLEKARAAVNETTNTDRTFYSTDIPLDNVRAVQLAPGRALNESTSSVQGNVFMVPRRRSNDRDQKIADRIRAGAEVKKLQSFKKIDLGKTQDQVSRFPSTDSTKLAWTRFPITPSFNQFNVPEAVSGLRMDVELDSRKYFTKREATRATQEIVRLNRVNGLLNKKIDELRSWRDDLNRYREEVAELHRKTVQNDLGNFLSIAQIGKVAEKLSKMRDYENAIDPKLVNAIKEVDSQLVQAVQDTESFLKAFDSQAKANKSEDETKQIVNSLESACSLLEVSIQRLPEGGQARKYLEAALKIYQSGLKVIAHEENANSKENTRAERIFTTVEIMAIFYPPASVGLGIGNEINDIRLRKNYIEPAAESLRYGLSKNWDAERSLTRKIQRNQIFIEQHQRVVSNFEGYKKVKDKK